MAHYVQIVSLFAAGHGPILPKGVKTLSRHLKNCFLGKFWSFSGKFWIFSWEFFKCFLGIILIFSWENRSVLDQIVIALTCQQRNPSSHSSHFRSHLTSISESISLNKKFYSIFPLLLRVRLGKIPTLQFISVIEHNGTNI